MQQYTITGFFTQTNMRVRNACKRITQLSRNNGQNLPHINNFLLRRALFLRRHGYVYVLKHCMAMSIPIPRFQIV